MSHDEPDCPKCHCSTLTMRVRTVTLLDGRKVREFSCDACGHGWKVAEPVPALVGTRDVAGFVGGSEY